MQHDERPMMSTSRSPRARLFRRICWSGLAFSAMLVLFSCAEDQALPEAEEEAAVAYRWVELGPEGTILVRAVIAQGESCPAIQFDASTQAMTLRSPSPPPGFEEVQVCESVIPGGTTSASIGGQALALPAASPQKIVVVGDTGCRVKGDDVQNCDGVDVDSLGPAWNFAQVAASIGAVEPDLIIHVGDYHYREYGTCGERCDQSTIGYTWASWEADFFEPAKTLLPEAPWVFIRGNHEDCGTDTTSARAWKGWFYFLDPRALPADPWAWQNCQTYTDPYRVPAGAQNILVMDTSEIPDDYAATPDTATVARYAHEFTVMDGLADEQTPAWLSTHRPFWAVASFMNNGQPQISFTDLTLQAALKASEDQGLPASVDMLIAGHVHQFEKLTFPDGRPPQLVFGGGATMLDPMITDSLFDAYPSVLQELGITRQDFTSIHNIDFGVIEPADGGGWIITIKNADGQDETSFTVSDR